MSGALNGVKILGFTHFAQAPLALQLLGDMGADIINVEHPQGEFERSLMTSDKVNGESVYFLAMNRNKRCLTLDLKNETSKEIIKKLLLTTDVVVSNFRSGVLDKLGFGYEDVKKINPKIIYCEALGYGSSGPYKNRPGQDLLAQAISGYATIVGTQGLPMPGGVYLVDAYSSIMLTTGICAALYERVRSGGEGQKVEVNLLDSAMHLQAQEYSYYLNTGELPKRAKKFGSHVHMRAPYGIFATDDGYIAISVTDASQADALGEILGVKDLKNLMPDNETMLNAKDPIFEAIQEALYKNGSEYWVGKLLEKGFWSAKVNDYSEVEKDPQVIHNKIIQEIYHPVAGKVRVIGSAIQMSKTPTSIRMAPPLLGQHTVEILKELGYSKEAIEKMKEENVY